MSKKKAPALHERRGREDISTRPPRLAGSPIKLAGKTRLRRLSLAADSCVNRKYYGGDPGVGQRARGFVHKPCIRSDREGAGRVFRSIKSWARTKATLSGLRLVRNLRKTRPAPPGRSYVAFAANPRVRWPARPTHNPYVGGLMCCVPLGYKVEMKVDRRFRPSSRFSSETQ